MNKQKTLREVCLELSVSRRAIQGYEKMGLVNPTSKNERGYLMYDYAEIQRISKVMLFQEFGFSLAEIKSIIDAPKEVVKDNIIDKIDVLKRKRKLLEETIKKAEKFINE